MKILVWVFCLTLPVSLADAQKVSVYAGGKLGVPFTRNLPKPYPFGVTAVSPQGPRLSMAPAFTLLVDERLAVDVEGVFRLIRYETVRDSERITSFDTIRATAFEVPVIVSYHF